MQTIESEQRMMHWICRKCGGKWSEPIVDNQKLPPSGERRADAHETSFCDACLDKM